MCHKCDNRGCVNPDHLFFGTHSDNMKDAANKGRIKYPDVHGTPRWRAAMRANTARGEDVHTAKLIEADVITIRKRRVAGEPAEKLAAEYGLEKTSMIDLCKGRTWKVVFKNPDCPSLGDLLAVERNTRPAAKITPEVALQIKQALAKGEMGKDIAERFGLHKATVSDIRRGKIWRDV